MFLYAQYKYFLDIQIIYGLFEYNDIWVLQLKWQNPAFDSAFDCTV